MVGAAHTLIGRRKLVGRKEERKEGRKEWASNVDWKKNKALMNKEVRKEEGGKTALRKVNMKEGTCRIEERN